MSDVLKSSDLIRSIKRRAMLPSDQNTFTNEDFLEMANEEIKYFGVEHVMEINEEYFVRSEDQLLEENKTKYSIPNRAIGNKLRDVMYVEVDESNPQNDRHFEMSRISLEHLPDHNRDFQSDYARLFYVQDDKICIVDPVTEGGSLRMFFYLRPNALVEESKAGIITSIDRNSGIVTISSFPEAFATASEFDFVQAKSPNKIISYDLTPTAVDQNTKSVTFATTDIPEDLVIGDYLNVAGECVVPQLPSELHAVVAQRVAVAALEALGDEQGKQSAEKRLQMMEESTYKILDNRVEGANEKVSNRHSTLRESVSRPLGRKRGWRY